MYFVEQFLDLANKAGAKIYIQMVQRDIIRLVDAVAPEDGTGAANVKIVRKVGEPILCSQFPFLVADMSS